MAALPARIKGLYVFGSYARGALEPGDLDLVVAHDPIPDTYFKQLQDRHRCNQVQAILLGWRSVQTTIRRLLVRPGERVQLVCCQRLLDLAGPGKSISLRDIQLIWFPGDSRWKERIAAILPNPRAGRAPRNHLLDLRRTSDSRDVMEQVVAMVQRRILALKRIALEHINPSEPRMPKSVRLARRTAQIYPYALWWLRRHRQIPDSHQQCEIVSKSGTHRVHLGRIGLAWMLQSFCEQPRLKRQCLIPHIRKSQPNELFVFQRGSRWRECEEWLRD